MAPSSTDCVFVVEDDDEVRRSLAAVLSARGYPVRAFASAEPLRDLITPQTGGCLILDLVLPACRATELLGQLRQDGCFIPALVITGHQDVASAVEAMRRGALDYLVKPVDTKRLLELVAEALRRSRTILVDRKQRAEVERRLAELTRREHEVLDHVVAGRDTKEIARRLGISPKTVEVHRSHITRKMHVGSVVQLVRLVTEHRLAEAEWERQRTGKTHPCL